MQTVQISLLYISIHALRKESDYANSTVIRSVSLFQSTLSVRRATIGRMRSVRILSISIHALRKESDSLKPPSAKRSPNFNPRSP